MTANPIVAIGIDLAVQPSATGVCVLREDGDGWSADFARNSRSDPGLVEMLSNARERAIPVAVDVPLGWPRKFIDFLQNPDLFDLDQDAEGNPSYRYIDLRLRGADQALRDHLREVARSDGRQGQRVPQPLSVSTDKLGAATIRWHAIRAQVMRKLASPPDDVMETYPAAARFIWGWTERKSPPSWVNDRVRGLENRSETANEHEWDALVAALVASLDKDHRLALSGSRDEAPDQERIWVPRDKEPGEGAWGRQKT